MPGALINGSPNWLPRIKSYLESPPLMIGGPPQNDHSHLAGCRPSLRKNADISHAMIWEDFIAAGPANEAIHLG